MTDAMPLQHADISALDKQAEVNFSNAKPHNVYERLPMVLRKAEEARQNEDENSAYIFYQRWLNSVSWIKRTTEYRKNKTGFADDTSDNLIKDVRNKIENLKQKINKRHRQISKEKVLKGGSVGKMELDMGVPKDTHNHIATTDLTLTLPETPTDDPINYIAEGFISCSQLYKLKQETDRYLLIDIRLKEDFKSSRILLDKCINIPSSEIETCKVVNKYADYLDKDKHALNLFEHRSDRDVDMIILLDWNTTYNTITPNNPLCLLKTTFKEWDPGVKHKKIVVLDGGYSEWLNRYPQLCSNPKIMPNPEPNDIANDILEGIDYHIPLLSDDEDNSKQQSVDNFNHTSTTKANKMISQTNIVDNKKRTGYILPEAGDIFTQTKNLTNRSFNSSIDSKARPENRPVVDRSSKPATTKSNDNDAQVYLHLLKQLNELAKDEEKLEKEILELERSLHMNCEMKPEDEKGIHKDIIYKRYKVTEVQKAYSKCKEDWEKYKSMDPKRFSCDEETEKDSLSLSIFCTRKRIEVIDAERKDLIKTPKPNEQKLLAAKYNDSSIHKESLKMDNLSINTGLTRSYSSPNLCQQIDRNKAPQVDRSSKPQVRQVQNGCVNNTKINMSRLNWGNREERMTPVHGSVHPGITGLKNLGNSCYMNSIIQCLSNTTYLRKYFTDNLYMDDLNPNNENSAQCQVAEEVAQVIKALWRGQYKSISPHDLKVAIGLYKLQFVSYEQQDSHEFLTFLLEWMHNELKKKSNVPDGMSIAEKEWDKAMDSQRSVISDLFFGQLRSTIMCAFCNEASTTYETFNSLTMSLPHSNRCTLNECMQRFVSGQKVSGWKCPKCKVPREATKKFDFVKLAPVVIIHLNRFAESGGWLEKRNIAVDFPLAGFDLRPYLITSETARGASNVRNYNYNLYAISNHYGTMEGGHYTAFCKNAGQNKWYKYDDQTVTEVAPSHVKSQNTSTYLLFYTSFPNAYI